MKWIFMASTRELTVIDKHILYFENREPLFFHWRTTIARLAQINSLPYDKNLDWVKLKVYADDKSNCVLKIEIGSGKDTKCCEKRRK